MQVKDIAGVTPAATQASAPAAQGKTNIGLVEYVKSKLGVPYLYGAKMEMITQAKYNTLKKTYGTMVWVSDASKVGKVCCDCSGLISAYTGKARSSTEYRNAAKEAFAIGTVATAPVGALVWVKGHIGVYVGMENGTPMYIAEDGSAVGCRKAKLPNGFTHWFLCTDIGYISGAAAPATSVAPAALAAPAGKKHGIAAGHKVKVKSGATYGGSARGKAVPDSVIGRRMTVGRVETHGGVDEALLSEINSWVPVDKLESDD